MKKKSHLFIDSYISSRRVIIGAAFASGLSVLSVFFELVLTSSMIPYLDLSTDTVNRVKLLVVFNAALLFFIIFPYRHYKKEGPIYASIDWYPQWWGEDVHKAKKRDELKLPEEGQMRVIITTRIVDNLNKYRFQLESSGGIIFRVDRELLTSNDQTTNALGDTIICKEVIHTDFVNTLTIEKDGPLGGGDNHFIAIRDKGENRDKELLRIEVRE